MNENKNVYCPHCRGYVSSHIESKCEDLNVKGLTVKVDERVRVCDGCGKELFDRELEKEIEKAAFEAYRQQKGLLKPEEIKRIRMKYGLSQVAFAKLLGFGEKTIARYESGSLQDEAPNSLIYLMDRPINMIDMLKEYGAIRLSTNEVKMAMKLAQSLIYLELSVYKAIVESTEGDTGVYTIQQTTQKRKTANWRRAS